MRRIAVLDAPSNLGLRPPTPTSVPGCAKAPGALRDHGLLRRLNARDAGCLTAPRYDPGDWRPGDGVCHAPEISAYSRKLADRIGAILDQGEFPVVLGGDCSIVLGSALAMHRLGEAVGGRIGLVFVDGHSDFRHPGNASYVGAAAGEDLALVTGRGQTDLAAMEGRRPYYRDIDVVVMGIRAQDEYRLDLQAAGIVTRPVPTLRVEGAARSAQWARDQLVDCAGYWVHIDVDVLDPAVMPAVDAPEPGGIAFPELEILLAGLVESPHCLGVEITVFDPDYDPDGKYAEEITSAIVAGLKPAQLVDARPDLVAARRDLAGPGRLGPGRSGSGPGRLAPGQRGPAEQDPVEARRAAAAGDDVRAAAAGMSNGESPATTLAGVSQAGEVPAFPAAEGGSDQAEFEALSRRADPDGASPQDAEQEDVASPAGAFSRSGSGVASPFADPGDGHDVASPFSEPDDAASAPDDGQGVASPSAGAGRDVASPFADVDDGPEVASPFPGPGDAHDVAMDDAGLPDGPDAAWRDAGSADLDDDAQAGVGTFADADHSSAETGDGLLAATDDDHPAATVDAEEVEPGEAADQDRTDPDSVADHGDVDSFEVPDHEPAPDSEPDPDDLDRPAAEQAHEDADESGFAAAAAAAEGSADPAVDKPPAEPAPMRPLGSAPLLDSKPLPATMPGMLRPRPIEDFTLPAQRPAFEVRPEQPADLG
jgi:arginase family enzyme